jgi:hypothetical protein
MTRPGDPSSGPADDEVISEVLAQLSELRLRMSSDLTLASGAVDDDEGRIAADIVEAERHELARFHLDATSHLLDGSSGGEIPHQRAASTRRRARRLLPLLPALAVLAASAAAAAITISTQPSDHPPTPTRPADIASTRASSRPVADPAAVVASYRQLRHVVHGAATARAVITIADEMHRRAALAADQSLSANRLTTIILWLRREQQLIARHQPPGAAAVLSASRELVAKLLQQVDLLPAVTATAVPSLQPRPSTSRTPSPQPSPSHPSTSPQPQNSFTPSPSPSSSRPRHHHQPSSSSRPPTILPTGDDPLQFLQSAP